MALCVALDGSQLVVLGEYSAACTGYALMTAQEYASTPTLASLFAFPDTAQIQAAFMSGFSLPLILWLVSWGFGTVVNWFNDRFDVSTIED